MAKIALKTRRKVYIGNVVRNALVFNFRSSRGGTVNPEQLLDAVSRLFSLLDDRKIDYLLVGGIALLQYVEGRNTEDIDLIVSLPSLARLPEIETVGESKLFMRGRYDGLQIDFLLAENPVFGNIRRKYATRHRFVEREIPCATVEGLLILKLYALPSLYRQGNFARVGLYENDIATLLHDYRPAIEPLLEELVPHLSETELGSLRQIVTEIEQRIARFEKTSS